MKIIYSKIFYYEINSDENFPDYGIMTLLAPLHCSFLYFLCCCFVGKYIEYQLKYDPLTRVWNTSKNKICVDQLADILKETKFN